MTFPVYNTNKSHAVEALDESERNHRSLFDTVGDLLFVTDTAGVILHANAAAVEGTGFSLEELRGMHILDLHPADRRADAEGFFKAMLTGECKFCPLPLRTRAGQLLPVESRVWFGQWDGSDCVFGLSKDMSEQEAALQKFDRLFEINPALMAVSRVSDRVFTDVNTAFLQTLGFSRDEVIGNTSDDLGIFPAPGTHQQIAEMLEQTGRVRNVKIPVRTREGEMLVGLFSGEVIEHRGEGAFLTVITDITAFESARLATERWSVFQHEINLISRNLVTLPWHEVDRGITESLRRLGVFVQAHRSYIFQFRGDGMMDNTHEWCAEGISPQITNLKDQPMDIFPWWIEQLRRGETIHVSRVADLPPEATAEREILQMQDITSVIVVPLMRGTATTGFVGFDSVNEERVWPGFVPILLRVAADLLAAVLERSRSDQLLHESNARLEQTVAERTRLAIEESARARQANEELVRAVDTLTRTNQVLARTMEDLQASEERYRYAILASHDVIWEYDCIRDRKSWSALGNTLFGWQADAEHPHPSAWWMEKVHPEDRPHIEGILAASLACPDVKNLHAEYRLRKAGGEYAHVTDRCHILRDAAGSPVRLIGAMEDVSERRQEEIARSRLQQQLNQSQQIAHLGSWEYNRDEDRLLWSDETYRIFGLDRQQFGESYDAFLSTVHPEDRSRVEDAYRRSVADPGFPYELDHRLVRRDTGAVRVVREKCVHERDAAGIVARSFGFVQDITENVERDALLRQAQKLEALGRLTAGIAHEINNPVGFLINNFSALQTGVVLLCALIGDYRALCGKVADSPSLARDLAALQAREREGKLDFILADMDALFSETGEGFERIMGILSSMRSFSRHEANDVREAWDINEGIRATLVIARNEYKYHCSVNVAYGDDLPRVHCVPGKINQVILNLVVNAAQAIAGHDRDGKGGIAIRTFSDGPNVSIEIADDGPGIPAAIMDKMFEPFFTTKPPGSGTGLGLSISYDIIVNQHGGSLTVDSREGHGATFRVCLPIGGAAGGMGAHDTISGSDSGTGPTGERAK